jgi:hypothetical protein
MRHKLEVRHHFCQASTIQAHKKTPVNTRGIVSWLSLSLTHTYTPVQVNDICNAAGKELAIETGIHKIRDTWTSLSMELFPYTKGEISRGFILKSTDDITTAIDENMTALQVLVMHLVFFLLFVQQSFWLYDGRMLVLVLF